MENATHDLLNLSSMTTSVSGCTEQGSTGTCAMLVPRTDEASDKREFENNAQASRVITGDD